MSSGFVPTPIAAQRRLEPAQVRVRDSGEAARGLRTLWAGAAVCHRSRQAG